MPVYDEYVRPKKQPDLLSDRIPWRAVIAPGVVLHKDRWQTLQRTYAVRGPDVMGVAREVQGSLIMQANNVLKKLGGKWMLNSEAQRIRVTDLPPLPPSCPPLVRLLDADHRTRLLADPGIRETTYSLTLSWTPPPPSFQRWGGWFVRGPGSPTRPLQGLEAVVRDFLEQADTLMDLLKGVLAECRPMTTPETLTYLHSCVSDRWHSVALLASLMDIDHQLCDTALDPAGWYPQLGRWHLRVCSVNGYPRQSVVGIMRDLEALPLDFRWCTRWLGLERHVQQGILRKAQGAWVHEEKGLSDRLSENLSHEATRVLNRDATNKAEDVDIARQEIGADLLAYGQFTSTVTVWDADPDVAEQKRRMVMQAFAAREMATVEEGAHLVAAWFSSHPGNRVDNVNQTHQSSLTLAHLCPGLTAAWRGPERDAYLQGGPWFYAKTEGSTLFRVVNHLRDLGHSLVLGATGCHAPGTEILMDDGVLKKVEEIKIGDHVMGPDSLPRTVTHLYHGIADMVRITPYKGQAFEVTMEHVLSLKLRPNQRKSAGHITNIPVSLFLEAGRIFQEKHLLYRTGIEFPETHGLPIVPYLLGVLLGDGSLTCTDSVAIDNPDHEIRQAIDALLVGSGIETSTRASGSGGCPRYGLRRAKGTPRGIHPLLQPLKDLGLLGVSSRERHIPQMYKVASKENRLALLAGLLDTDGNLQHHCFRYVSVSRQLAEDVAFVARSLGLAAYVSASRGAYAFYVSISGHIDIIPCQVPRKQAEPRSHAKNTLITGIKCIEPLGPGEYYGFGCDGDHLYLMGDFTVTHNSGKSTLANFLRAMWMQYASAQAKLFDIDGHGRLLTLLLGGSWFDLGSPTARFQPLRHIDDPLRRGIAIQWLLDLMEEYHVPVTATVQAHIGGNITKLMGYPPHARTISHLLTLMADGARETELKAKAGRIDAQGISHPDTDLRALVKEWQEVRWVLQRFADGGEYDGLFDGTTDDFDLNPVQTFELRDLLQRPRLLGPILRYVFPQLDLQMTTDRPMLLLFDDVAIPWEIPKIRQDSKDWLRTTRKKSVSLGFMTHSLADIFGAEEGRMSDMGPMLMESCPVRFYLANPEAAKPTIRAIYRRLGLEDTAIDQVAVMRPQRDAYYELREVGQRPFSLPFSRFMLDCLARNDASDHRLIDEILQKEGREGFPAAWMAEHGYSEAAEVLRHSTDGTGTLL